MPHMPARRHSALATPSARITSAARKASAATDVPVGARIRTARRRRHMTLDQLAQAVQMDKGFLSRLERGEKSASIGTVQNIARALGLSVAALLGETHDPAEVRVVRSQARTTLARDGQEGGHAVAALTLSERGEPFSAYVVDVGDEVGRVVAHHAGQELVHVLRGRVRLRFPTREEVLEAGDSAVFPGYLPHRVSRVGRARAQVLIVVGGS